MPLSVDWLYSTVVVVFLLNAFIAAHLFLITTRLTNGCDLFEND